MSPTEPARHRPPVGSLRIRLTGLMGGAQVGSGFWSSVDESTSSSDLDTIASDIYTAWASNVLTDQDAAATLEKCEVLLYRATDELAGTHVASSSGAASGTGMPANCAACVNWATPSTWRGGHPRTFVWGVPISALDASYQKLSSAYRSALTSNMVGFAAAVNAITTGSFAALNTMRFFSAGAALSPPYLVSLLAPSVDLYIGSQRRRLRSP